MPKSPMFLTGTISSNAHESRCPLLEPKQLPWQQGGTLLCSPALGSRIMVKRAPVPLQLPTRTLWPAELCFQDAPLARATRPSLQTLRAPVEGRCRTRNSGADIRRLHPGPAIRLLWRPARARRRPTLMASARDDLGRRPRAPKPRSLNRPATERGHGHGHPVSPLFQMLQVNTGICTPSR
jgi:hypothetical protein